ncbi:MAG TPA: anthranilate phosphoribosyltransferase [Jatrophihabitantaceae bacterium]|nr:anthranilate phosphoribosyltransferase [Jatrophihabitantaceae bacterium]
MTESRPADESGHSWPKALSALMRGEALAGSTTAWAMDEIMSGNASSAQLASFAVLLRAKGETAEELAGLVAAMLARALPVVVEGRTVDVVGTGGDQAHTVNITTMAALVVAGTGRRVVKHGNRSASSLCGTADVLEELGVAIDLGPAGVASTALEAGIGFCFAPVFHPGLRHAGPARREIGVPTAFNLVGPLTNPARPGASAIGCADLRLAPVMAGVFALRGDDALVFRGDDGLDELTTTTTSRVWITTGGEVSTATVDPAAYGLPLVDPSTLRGGDRTYNAAVVRQVLAGERGPVRDAVLLNAAAAVAVHDGPAHGNKLAAQIGQALDEVRTAIDSGAAAQVLRRWIELSQRARIQA